MQVSTAHIIVAVRTLATNAVVKYDTGWTVTTPTDEHDVPAIALDKNGYIHLVNGTHAGALLYRKSTNPEDASSFSGNLSMLGTHESSFSYPMFVKDSSGELYFTFRDGVSDNGDQYFYHYNASTMAWEAPAGTGSGGIIVNGKASPHSAYLNGPPKFDPSGTLWFQFSWDTTGINEYLIGWNGTSFIQFGGAAQTIPATNANLTPVLTLAAGQVQMGFTIDQFGVFYLPLVHDDGAGSLQVYVAESSTGAFVQHQLTANSGNTIANTVPVPYPTMFTKGLSTYILFPDNFTGLRQIVAFVSGDHFLSSREFYPFLQYNPNWSMNPDPTRLASGVASFVYQDANDPTYGAVYATGPNLGYLSILDWIVP